MFAYNKTFINLEKLMLTDIVADNMSTNTIQQILTQHL